MKNSMLMPCTDRVEKLAVRNSDDLSYSQRVALNEHLASCAACASAHSDAVEVSICRFYSASAKSELCERYPLLLRIAR